MSPEWESTLRLTCFLTVLVCMTLWEIAVPRRVLRARKSTRWTVNLGLMVLNTALVRICLPITAVAAAQYADDRHWGLLHLVTWPAAVKVVIAVIVLDFLIYGQHVVFHSVPWLWRFHRWHHRDVDVDVTTGVRFHSVEILLSALVKVAAVIAIGCSVTAVILFEIVLNSMAMFNHSNAKMPTSIDRLLRIIIVTPDMHRVHHSSNPVDHNHNFGFGVSCWDYWLRTYQARSVAGSDEFDIGLKN